MNSYIVRIYRRSASDIAGTVEAGTCTGFADRSELLVILGCLPGTIVVAPMLAPRQDPTHEEKR